MLAQRCTESSFYSCTALVEALVITTSDENWPSIGVDHFQSVPQIQGMKDGGVVHVTESREIINAILNLGCKVSK